MKVKTLKLPKRTGTYADALAITGLGRLLSLLGARGGRIEDKGGIYELTFRRPVDLYSLDYEWVHDDPGYRYIKLKKDSNAPPNSIDYKAERERLLKYRKLRNSLRRATKGRLSEEQRAQLKQAEPMPRWYLYQNVNVLQGFGPYNKLHEAIRASAPEEFAATLRAKLAALATGKDVSEVKGAFAPKLSVVQVFTPSVGKGVNMPKTVMGLAKTLSTGEFLDWFEEYLKYLGLELVTNARAIGSDIKLFVMTSKSLEVGALGGLSDEFFKLNLPWSSAQIDVQGSLGLAQILVGHLAQEESEERYRTPRDVVSGLQTAYFKSLGNARALANTSFIRLPGWFPVTEENANEWLEILEEHRRVLALLDEEKSEEAGLLFLYRDFLSAGDAKTLLEFLASYAPHVVKARERKRFVWQFTTRNLRRLLLSFGDKFKDIVDDPGFRAVAAAIRRATVIEQYHKAKDNQVFEIEYGLFQDLKRKARFPEQFISALSDFVARYNYENARREEQLKGKGGRRRPRLTTSDLDHVVELVDTKGSEPVAMLLIAYGSARDPRTSEDVEPAVVQEEVGQQGQVEENVSG
ncbi:MAG: hypothetical protein IN808_02765 [Rubrobacter sp.]|nr:hypothetical protein [Rubrobacter sp.]